jgi:uncharacterized protein (TIGR00251 family)
LKIKVRLQPWSSKPGVLGWEAGALKVRVSEAPVDGQANEGLIRILSRTFEIPRSSVSVSSGLASRNKVVDIRSDDASLESRIKNYVGA